VGGAATITLADMVDNGSLSNDGAELLAGIGASGRSFLVYALPRNAGKSTLVRAILAEAPPHIARRPFYGSKDEAVGLAALEPDGYLVVAEIGHVAMRGYLWQDEVRRLFDLVDRGYAVASSLHADSVEEVFTVLEHNGVPERLASRVDFLVKVRALGPTNDPRTRRVVESVHRIERDPDERVRGDLLYRWDVDADRFERLPRAAAEDEARRPAR